MGGKRLPIVRIDLPGAARNLARVLGTGRLTQGPFVLAFEEALRRRLGAHHAVAVNFGTSALLLALLALRIRGDVLVPAFTFPAVWNAVRLAGARPVFVDIGLREFNLRPDLLEEAATPRTRAIVAVHQFGHPVDMDAIGRIARRKGWRVVEDAACALGSTFRGRPCGTFGAAAAFSFHPRKLVTTGEGGAVVTRSAGVARCARALRNHGIEDGRFRGVGQNLRLSELSAAVGVGQFPRLHAWIRARARAAARYRRGLQGTAEPAPGTNWQTFTVLLSGRAARDRAIRTLRTEGIEATVAGFAAGTRRRFPAAHAAAVVRRCR